MSSITCFYVLFYDPMTECIPTRFYKIPKIFKYTVVGNYLHIQLNAFEDKCFIDIINDF